ncbi:ATP-grasp domain-containing protein [Nocardia sp. CDC160]|uniref:ATP-grasp domain-containing protein n=1 Tax=Nocardia sp. CDC160 TaxID=3112166 RepID=UPI002DB8AE2E|nr:hypothetical protein [Nocardia sp. CDC160]MEC3920359.1 hypothetical protein [Nocardia sp. CDC160]
MRPHILVIHRTRGPAVPYLDHIDHDMKAVTYICAENARDRVPVRAAAEVVTFQTEEGVPIAARELTNRHGLPERIVALDELDLLTAAALREIYDIDGDRLDHVLPFRDKLLMYTSVAGTGIAVPAFSAAPDPAAVLEFGARHSFPLIVKPRLGATSRDIRTLWSPEDVAELPDLDAEPFLVQQFCPGEIASINGVWTGSDLGPWRAARSFHTLLGFADSERSWGTVDIDDTELNVRLADFAHSVLATLSRSVPTVFHLELFLDPAGAPDLQLLEIACRIPEAETTHLWSEVYRYDLVGAALDIQLGYSPDASPLPVAHVAGQLLVRPAARPPCAVTAVHFEVAPEHEPYHSMIPRVGELITEQTGYAGVGASFRFCGRSSAQVFAALRATLAGFDLECTAAAPTVNSGERVRSQ